MPIQSIEEYIADQQQRNGVQFINRLRTTGVDVEQYRQPDGGYKIPLFRGQQLPATQQEMPGTTSSAFQRGFLNTGSDLASAAGVASSALGATDASEFFFGKAQQYNEKAQALPSTIPDFQSIDSGSDLATYIWERTVEQVPLLASLLIPGAATTKVAKLVGAAPKLASQLGWTSAMLVDAGLQVGESASIATQRGQDPVDMRVVGSGLGKAVLDFLPLFTIAKTVGLGKVLETNFIAQLAEKGYLKRVAGNALIVSAVEVPTEVAQEAINVALQRSLDQKGGDLTDDEWNQLKQAAAGALASSVGLAPVFAVGRPKVATVHDTNPPQLDWQVPDKVAGLLEAPIGPPGTPGPYSTFTVSPGGTVYKPGQMPDVRVYTSQDNSAFDSSTIYDGATGELRILGQEFRRALLKQNEQIAYDPSQDRILTSASAPTWRPVNPAWTKQADGTFKLADDAVIQPVVPDANYPTSKFIVFGTNGTVLGTFQDMQTAMRRGEEYSWQRSPVVTIGTDGDLRVSSALSPERVAAETARKSQQQTLMDTQMVQLDEAHTAADRRPDRFEVFPQGREEIARAQQDPGMQRLLELRAETLSDKDLYRKDNGALSSGGAKKVAGIELRIASLATKIGIPNPLTEQQEHPIEVKKLSVEERLSTIAQAAERKASQAKYRNLTLAEGSLYDRLQEKEIIEGLTDGEWQHLERLQTTLREGSDKPFKRKMTAKDVKELEAELNRVDRMEARYQAVAAEEAARAANEATGATTEVSESGDYLYSRKPRVHEMQAVATRLEAEQRWNAGETLYGFHEMDEKLSKITSLEMLAGYPPDTIYYRVPGAKAEMFHLPRFEVDERLSGAYGSLLGIKADGKDIGFVAPDDIGNYHAYSMPEIPDMMNIEDTEAVLETSHDMPGEAPPVEIRERRTGKVLTAVFDTNWAVEHGANLKELSQGQQPSEYGHNEPMFYVWNVTDALTSDDPSMGELLPKAYASLDEAELAARKLAAEKISSQASPGEDLGVFKSALEAVKAIKSGYVRSVNFLKRSAAGLRANYKALSREDAVDAIHKLWEKLQIKPRLRIVTLAELSPEERRHAEGASGLFSLKRAGEVTLVLDNLFSKAHAQLTFVHETLAHFGLRAFFTPEELQVVLKEVLAARKQEIEDYTMGRGNATPVLTLRDAEEFIARKTEEAWVRWTQGEKDWEREPNYEKPGDRTFIGKIIAFFKRVLRGWGIGLNKEMWSDQQIARMMKDVAMFLTGKITGRNPAGVISHFTTSPMMKTVGRANLSEAVPNMNSFAEVWGAKFATFFMTPLQLAEKYGIPGAAKYLQAVQLWWARKRDLTTDAVNTALKWQDLPKRDGARLSQAILEIKLRSDELGRRLTDEEVAAALKEFGLGKDAQVVYQGVDQSFKTVLNQLQFGLEFGVLREHTRDKAQAQALHKLWREKKYDEFYAQSKEILGNLEVSGRLSQIEKEMNQLRERNYFPHMRFGKYGLYVRAKQDLTLQGKSYNSGQIVYFESFETFRARDQRTESMLAEYPPRLYDIGYGHIADSEFTFLGMPPSLYEALQKGLKLDAAQTERLKELYFTRSPGRAFLRHLVKRRGIAGFSRDAMRVYSTYMMNAANHIARVEFHQEMGDELNTMRTAGKSMGDVAGIIGEYFGKHYSYIMNPGNDLAQLRSLGFLFYLGYNVKSAMVNLTQVPMVAYPYLASLHGDNKAVAAIAKAYGTTVRIMRGHSVVDDATQLDLNRALREGVIDESQASELAGLAEAPVLQRLMGETVQEQLLSNVSYYGGWLFRHAEKFNRRVTFLAARELALQSGLKGEDVYLAGRKAVQTTMFEYAKWNRPAFMRGKKSAFFLFWNYMQHLSFLSFGGQGKGPAIRIWTMLMLAAGLQGLPFAENILDLLDLGSTKAKELLGSNDPHTDLRADLRGLAQTLTDNPDMIMHGLSRHYGLGPLHLLQLLGVPVPGTDTSASISAGRVIPGVDQLTAIDNDPDKRFGQAIIDSLGPVAGIGYNFWRVLTSQDPDQWKVWERAMPSAIKSASQAVRRWDRGAETFRGGGDVATFDPHDGIQRAELIANSLGFQPSRVTERYELRSLQEDVKQYWTTRRAMVLENYAYAFLSHDLEAKADAREAIRRFNSQAPAPQLKVSMDTIERSIKGTLRRSSLREDGLPNEKAFVPMYRSVSRLFPDVELSSDHSDSSPSPPPQ